MIFSCKAVAPVLGAVRKYASSATALHDSVTGAMNKRLKS